MRIALLHTSAAHIETFDRLFADLGATAKLQHRVEASLLDKARSDGLDAVRDETWAILSDLAQADAVICSCTTLGPLADEKAAETPNLLRIDQPMMQAACRAGPNILVAICLESTRAPTLELLQRTAEDLGTAITPEVLFCGEAWPLFESGHHDAFSGAIADQIRARLARGGVSCVVLAQASMMGAAAKLADLDLPVLSSPALAAQRAVEIATRESS